ncbi:MAG TPA: cation-translocating P-type ATPase [Thermoleophilia bacterium]|nr:cation-translocating P-type ATPase [Thermoleophilia bacterium]
MTERTLELALLLPRAAECGGCVDEVGQELLRLDGIHAVEPDVSRGLLQVSFDERELAGEEVETFARRAGAQAHCEDHCPLAVHAHGPLDLSRPLAGEDGHERRILHVTGMDCADCAVKLQGALRREPGVRDADVNFGAATLAIAIDPGQTAMPDVYRAVRRLGYDTVERRAEAARQDGGTPAAAARTGRGFWLTEPRALATLVSGVFTLAGFVAYAVAPAAAPWLFAAAAVSGGVFVARAAVFSLHGRQVDMNVLMTLAMIGAAAIGQWSEAALVAFLFSFGTVLQAATLERTRRAISGLMKLAPPTATVLRRCPSEGELEETDVDAAGILVGEVVVIHPGERAAVDGVVVEGAAAADQAPVTGESAPVAKGPGDQVFAGSIIEGGTLRVRATAAASDTTIAKIVHMVEEAQAQRAPAETIVDRFASRYTPAVVALAAAVAFVPPLFGASFETWFYRGLALLIISCPCALVISTPVSVLAALARATRNGVLIKGGAYLEQMAGIKAVAFDKTGTLTLGRPQVTDVVVLNGASEEHVLEVAAALERYSEHPLARAITARADDLGVAVRPAVPAAACACAGPGCCAAEAAAVGTLEHGDRPRDRGGHEHDHTHGRRDGRVGPDVERFRAIPGRGVRAELDGRLHFVGRPDLLGAHAEDAALRAAVERLERQGKTAVAVGDEDGALGVIAVSDPLRDDAREALEQLRALGVTHVAMLSGDNPDTAAAVAAEAGVTDVRAGLLPQDKVAAVAEIADRAGAVAMVGDGVNDAPALAAASIGIAMGAAGTDAALETADIALMGDDLSAVPDTIRLARRTTRVIWQNIVFSVVVKSVFLVLAPLGLVTLWLAVFADMGTSLLVTGNGLRLYRR